VGAIRFPLLDYRGINTSHGGFFGNAEDELIQRIVGSLSALYSPFTFRRVFDKAG
jgi:hypothetical protein